MAGAHVRVLALGCRQTHRLELADDLEHLDFHHGTGDLEDPLVTGLEADGAPDFFDQLGVDLGDVLLYRSEEFFLRNHVCIQRRVRRYFLEALCAFNNQG